MFVYVCGCIQVRRSEVESDSPLFSHSRSPPVKESDLYHGSSCWHVQMILGDNVACSLIYMETAKLPLVGYHLIICILYIHENKRVN